MTLSKITETLSYLASLPRPIVIGVSGGVDSMVLLDLTIRALSLSWAKDPMKSKIIVGHIDHQIRPESQDDAEFVRAYCIDRNIPCEIATIDVSEMARLSKESLEATGRKVRYEWFEKIRASEGALTILTAHHQDDSIETMLMGLIRGSRLRGLSGISPRQGTLVRPILSLSKSEILEYAESEGIPYREDSTNTDTTFVRNRIRHSILPEMEAINPEVRSTLAGFMEYARELDTTIEGLLGVYLSGNSISEDDFGRLSPLLQRSFIEKIYARIHHGTIGLSQGNIEELRRYFLEANGGTMKNLGKLELVKKHGVVMWNR